MRWIALLTSLFLFLTPLFATAGEVRVCVYENPPLSSTDSNGQASGLLPDLLREVAKIRNWQLNFSSASWHQCLERLDSGRVDVLPTIAYTEERAGRYRFGRETVLTNWGQIFQFRGETYDSILDLAGQRVAVLGNDVHYLGANGLRTLADNFGIRIDYVEVPSYLEAFSRLSRGEVDAALVNRLFGLNQHDRFEVKPTSILFNPIQIRPAFSLASDPALPDQLDAVLADWKQDQSSIYFSLLDIWLKPASPMKLPSWLEGLLLSLAALLGLMVLAILWARRQIAAKTVQLEEKNQFLQSVIDGVSDPLMVITSDYRVVKMNRAAKENLPVGGKDLNQPTCFRISHARQSPCDGENHPCPLEKVRETGEPVTMIHHHLTKRGRRIFELNASPLFNPDGSLQAVIEVTRDITERLQVEELLSENEKRLHHLAHHDPLTELPNRLLFEDRLKQALSKARRNGKGVALLFLDLDHFKDINDNLGHDFGDLLLIDIANRLRSCVRESDTVARMGGDEFLVLLEEVESYEMVEQMAERIIQALAHELTRDTYYQRVSASIGISLFPEDGHSDADLLRNADLAMYRAKNLGKATYQFHSSPQTASLFE